MSVKKTMKQLAKNLRKIKQTGNTMMIHVYRCGVEDTLDQFEPECDTGSFPFCNDKITCEECPKKAYWDEWDKAVKEA